MAAELSQQRRREAGGGAWKLGGTNNGRGRQVSKDGEGRVKREGWEELRCAG